MHSKTASPFPFSQREKKLRRMAPRYARKPISMRVHGTEQRRLVGSTMGPAARTPLARIFGGVDAGDKGDDRG